MWIKNKENIKCDKSIIICDIGIVQCDNRTIKCDFLVTRYSTLTSYEYHTPKKRGITVKRIEQYICK